MRNVIEQLPARATSDGDGVKLLRVFGGREPERFDPFLMLDEFGSDESSDYIGGFPAHPHRGFETVTYMLQGKMEHRDHMGNIGLIDDGDVQWMTAGKGIIHSEMPKQTEGRMHGFQLWVNLPAHKKLQPASYGDIKADTIPTYYIPVMNSESTVAAKVIAIAGEALINERRVTGYSRVPDTNALYLDVELSPNADIHIGLTDDDTALIYVYKGAAHIGDIASSSPCLNRLSSQGDVVISNWSDRAIKLLVLAGTPLNEPIVQYGPFVMNTVAEIEQAVEDYRNGVLTD